MHDTNCPVNPTKMFYVVFGFSNCCILVFQILFSTEVVTRLSYEHVALIKTFCGIA